MNRVNALSKQEILIIGADHAGYKLKKEIVDHLTAKGCQVVDVGTDNGDSVDYPDYAAKVAGAVSEGEYSRGILICGSGIGMAIAANKFAGVRAAPCNDPECARLSRAHNDANVLTVGARSVSVAVAKNIIDTFLDTEFEAGRHQKRVDKISRLEKRKG